MKKTTYTQPPVIPKGYTGTTYNNWMKYVTEQVSKLTGTHPDQRLIKQ